MRAPRGVPRGRFPALPGEAGAVGAGLPGALSERRDRARALRMRRRIECSLGWQSTAVAESAQVLVQKRQIGDGGREGSARRGAGAAWVGIPSLCDRPRRIPRNPFGNGGLAPGVHIARCWHGICFVRETERSGNWLARAVKHGRVRSGRPVIPGIGLFKALSPRLHPSRSRDSRSFGLNERLLGLAEGAFVVSGAFVVIGMDVAGPRAWAAAGPPVWELRGRAQEVPGWISMAPAVPPLQMGVAPAS